MPLPVTPDDVARAHALIASHVRRTPTWQAPRGTLGAPGSLSLKLELLQHAGSFKTRGAFHTLLAPEERPRAVAAASGGNHGVAVAYAARRLELPARIFVPEIASPAKVAAIRAQGADIEIGGRRYADAQEACDRFVAESGALRVHPFDAVTTIAGAGTVALEWDEDARGAGGLDTVLVACGGGGLAAGLAAFWAGRVRVIAVEPEGWDDMQRSLAAGHIVAVEADAPPTLCDALQTPRVSPITFGIFQERGVEVVTVSEAEVAAAVRFAWRMHQLVVEPGGAAALAAVLAGKVAMDEDSVIVLSGGNIDPALHARLVS